MFITFIKHEFKCNIKNFGNFLQNILFFLLSCFIFFLLSSNHDQSLFAIINVMWIAILFSLLFANNNFLNQDYIDGNIEQIILICPHIEIYIISKIIASWIFYALPILIVSPFILIINNCDMNLILSFIFASFFATIAINFIYAFCGSLNIISSRMSLLTIIAFPLLIPILLIANSVSATEFLSEDFISTIKILVAMTIFIASILLFFIARIIKITIS